MELDLCAYCGKDNSLERFDREHFPPQNLWPKGHRPKNPKWVPAHKSCNGSFSDDDDYFRDIFIMEAGAKTHPMIKILHEQELKRKIAKRLGTVKKTLRHLTLLPVETEGGVFIGRQPCFPIERHRFDRVLCKIVQCMFYDQTKSPMPIGWQFWIFRTHDGDLQAAAMQQLMTDWQDYGDDVFQYRTSIDPNQRGIACIMKFYSRRSFIGIARAPAFTESKEAIAISV